MFIHHFSESLIQFGQHGGTVVVASRQERPGFKTTSSPHVFGLIGDSNLPIGVNMSVNGWELSISLC